MKHGRFWTLWGLGRGLKNLQKAIREAWEPSASPRVHPGCPDPRDQLCVGTRVSRGAEQVSMQGPQGEWRTRRACTQGPPTPVCVRALPAGLWSWGPAGALSRAQGPEHTRLGLPSAGSVLAAYPEPGEDRVQKQPELKALTLLHLHDFLEIRLGGKKMAQGHPAGSVGRASDS